MIRSMTGYHSSRIQEADFSLAVHVKSVNHRFLDVQIRLPSGMEGFDPLLRRLVTKYVARGRVEVQVSLERLGAPELRIDRKLLGAYLRALKELLNEFGFVSEPDVVALFR